MKNPFESDDQCVFGKRLFELCLDHSAHGLPINFGKEVYDLLFAFGGVHVRCESPIEKMLGAALIFANDGRSRLQFRHPNNQHCAMELEDLKAASSQGFSVISPQVRVGNGYRVDFLIVTHLASEEKLLTALECDGHDFHEKTKEQASRDKKRDRALVAEGITTLRFTGSDIHHRLDDCIVEIQNFLAGKTWKHGVAA